MDAPDDVTEPLSLSEMTSENGDRINSDMLHMDPEALEILLLDGEEQGEERNPKQVAFLSLTSSQADSDRSLLTDGFEFDRAQSMEGISVTSTEEETSTVQTSHSAPETVPARARGTNPRTGRRTGGRRALPRRGNEEPQVFEYVDNPTSKDVLLGRGGKTNGWQGNKRYRREVKKIQHLYFAASKQEKTAISSSLVETVQGYGGRFLRQKDGETRWYVVPGRVARRKASQALREN